MKIHSFKTNVNSFSVQFRVFIQNSELIKSLISEELIGHIEDASKILCFRDEIIILDSLNRGYRINGSRLLEERIIDIKKNYLLIYSKSPQYYAIIDNNFKILISEINNFGKHIFDDLVIEGIGDADFVKIRNIPVNNILASFPLAVLGTWLDGTIEKPHQVLEFSGIYKNTLICTMNSGGILLLNIEKGLPKQFFREAKVRGGVFQKEENSPIFFGLKHYTFIEINAETSELVRQVNIVDELKRVAEIPSDSPSWLSVGTSVYKDGLFYFYGDKNFLGIFDPVNEEIIDYHWFKFENKHTQLKGGVENLQVKENEIYCLDTANTLHVLCR